MTESFLNDRVTLHPGDCLEVLKTLEPDSIDSVVTDPPYHLTSIVKRFGAENAAPAKSGKTGAYKRASAGFMGKQWDGGEIAFEPETWAAVYRVLKPGGHLCAFGAPKNFGFMQYAISQGGFEIRDVLCWLFGSGFPKSHNQPGGFGTALKPAYEPIILARKPLIGTVAQNIEKHGTGALNIDGCRVAAPEGITTGGAQGHMPQPEDWGNESRIIRSDPHTLGRWPANVIHDGSDEVVGAFPETTSGTFSGHRNEPKTNGVYGKFELQDERGHVGDSGSAARFFYTAKADADDRLGSKHPTVKPISLLRWLVRLVTPPHGLILDPFAGTGTTGAAAYAEGFSAILIERETEYCQDIARRMALVHAGPEERQRESLKAGDKVNRDAGPLFAQRVP